MGWAMRALRAGPSRHAQIDIGGSSLWAVAYCRLAQCPCCPRGAFRCDFILFFSVYAYRCHCSMDSKSCPVRNVSGFDVGVAVRGRIFDKYKHTKYMVHLYSGATQSSQWIMLLLFKNVYETNVGTSFCSRLGKMANIPTSNPIRHPKINARTCQRTNLCRQGKKLKQIHESRG